MAHSLHDSVCRPDMEANPDPDPVAYENEIYRKGLDYVKPAFTFKSLDWEGLASTHLSAESRGYLVGNAGTGETAQKNRKAFSKWSIVPRRLIDTQGKFPDLSVRVIGHANLPFPIALAPVGVQKIFNPDGELASAAAAAATRVPFIMSTASSSSIEDVASANGDGVRWFQLYWPANENELITISMLTRAKKAGFSALFVTLDTFVLGWRPSDMDNGYNPFLRSDQIGTAIGFTDPLFRARFRAKHQQEIEENPGAAASEWTRTIFPGFSHSWDDIKFLQKHWDGPIVLKGIQDVDDARKAVEMGIQGIVVSNHAGRQTDGGNSSLGILPAIADAVGSSIEIFFDSGIRCGADIAKALALGAKMCLVGRQYAYGLALGGRAGVEHIVKTLCGDLELTLHLSGIPSVEKQHLNRSRLLREDQI